MSDTVTRDDQAIFREVQRLPRWRIWPSVLAVGFAWFTLLREVQAGKKPGDDRAPDRSVVLNKLLVGLGLPLLIIFSRLVVEVSWDGLYFRYLPFHRRFHRIAFEKIAKVEARTYRPIMEYGGWGIRWTWSGKAYNIGGNRGVQLVLTNGKKILFGSQRADELATALKQAMGA